MSISVQQLKKILGSFSQIVAKDVSGIKTAYATKKDVEGFAKESEVETKLADYAKTAEVAATYATKEAVNAINGLDADTIATLKNLSQHSDLTAIANKVDNVYTKAETDDKLATKADVAAIPSVEGLAKATDVETTYAKKSELPDVSVLATKQEVTDAVANVQVPSIEGLAKVTDVNAKLAAKADVTAIPDISNLATKEEVTAVDTKLATKADISAIPSIEGLAKASEVETTYAKKSELPDVSSLATKAEVTEAVTGLAKASEVAETYATKEAVNAVAGLDSETINTLKSLAQNADLTTVAEKVKNVYTKTETDAKLATKADVSAIPDVSGLLTKAEAATSLASKLEIPDVSNLATKAEIVSAVSSIVIPSVDGLARTIDVDNKLTDYVKKSQLSDGSLNLVTKSEVDAIEGRLADFVTKSDVQTSLVVKQELNDYVRKADVSDVSVTKEAYDTKVQELESEISTLKSKLATAATIQSGTTEQRPTENLVTGMTYFDTTLGVPVFWNGTEWHNPFAKITTVEVEPH